MRRYHWLAACILVFTVGFAWAVRPAPAAPEATVKIAVIGDYGDAGPSELAVANLMKGWSPDIIITTGDNNYEDGGADTIDANVGQYFHDYIGNYQGSYGAGSNPNRFFPTLGNHDWKTENAQPYLDYFTLPSDLPGGERYYQFTWGPVHLFALDLDEHEPDGNAANSDQAAWLQCSLVASTAPWQLVYFHHSPYSSGLHAPTPAMRWPYGAWGADAVLAGHNHHYERLLVDGLRYFVVGTGGSSLYPVFQPHADHSQFVYDGDYGAMLIEASETSMSFKFFRRTGQLIDSVSMSKPSAQAASPDLDKRVYLPFFRRQFAPVGC